LCRAPPVSSLVSGARPDGTGRRSPPAVSTKDKSAPPLTPYWFCVPALARAYGCGRAIAERDNHSTSGNGTSLRQQLRQRSFRALSLQPISSTNTTSPSRLRRFLIAFCRGATLADVRFKTRERDTPARSEDASVHRGHRTTTTKQMRGSGAGSAVAVLHALVGPSITRTTRRGRYSDTYAMSIV